MHLSMRSRPVCREDGKESPVDDQAHNDVGYGGTAGDDDDSRGAAAAFAAPRSCADNSNSCKTDTTTQHSGNSSADFNTTTETQRGNTDAKGTETTSSTCTGPSGKTLDPSHPQCS